MADFAATDDFSEIVLRATSERGRKWALKHAGKALRPDQHVVSFASAPGYMMHTILPELRAAGLTVDGDIDTEGRVKIEVRV